MSKTTNKKTSWEEVFDYLTEDISMYCWAVKSWDDQPDGYDQGTLLWEVLNSRSRCSFGLKLIKEAPNKYEDSIKKLNNLLEIAEKELHGIIHDDKENLSLIIKSNFCDYQDTIEKRLKSLIKIAQDGDLLDDPDWIEDDLRETGTDFLIEFQQMANISEQLKLDIFTTIVNSRLFIEKFKCIEELFRNSFGYFNPLCDILDVLQKREYGKKNWWLSNYPEADDIIENELPEHVLKSLISSVQNESEIDVTDCTEAENAILYAFRELPRDDVVKYKEHLNSCSFCSKLVHDTRLAELQANARAFEEAKIPASLMEEIKGQDKQNDPELASPVKNILSEIFEKMLEFLTFPRMFSAVALACLVVFMININLPEIGKSKFKVDLSISGRTITDIGMRGWIFEFKERIFETDYVLQSGESFRVKMKSDQDAFYYLVSKNSQEIFNLFDQGEIESGDTLTYPNQKEWNRLDSIKGIETIILIVSDTFIGNFEVKMEGLKEKKLKEVFPESFKKEFSILHK